MSLLDLPELTRPVLAEMGSWTALRKAHALMEAGAVKSVDWDKPVLTGKLECEGRVYEPELNLRSLTFIQNKCQCGAPGGQACPHSLALCLAIKKKVEAGGTTSVSSPSLSTVGRHGGRPSRVQRPGSRVQRPQTWMVIDGSPAYLSIMLRDRDYPNYQGVVDWLRRQGFQYEHSNGKWWLRSQHKVLNFLAIERAEVDRVYAPGYTDGFNQRTAMIEPVKLRCDSIQDGRSTSLRLELTAEGVEPYDIRQALVSNCHYIIRGNKIHLIEKAVLDKFRDASRQLSGEPDLPLTGIFQADIDGAAVVSTSAVLDEFELEAELPADWTERSAAIREVGRLKPPPLPEEVAAKFRTYQLIGTAWLWHLYNSRLGGILADEMGLGKTIQAIGLILCYRTLDSGRWTLDNDQDANSSGQRPILIVAPASLLGNWKRELSNWAPGVSTYVHHGPNRISSYDQSLESSVKCPEYEVWLTSYSTLRNDVELFQEMEFAFAIADEAQHVKNRRTHAARSLRAIDAESRFVLTGTPIENTIEDLRSLFEFCLPGYLKRPPRDARGEEKEWHEKRHLEMAAPFILRRGKKMVAPELPDKIEQTLWCGLDSRQRDLYNMVQVKSQQRMMELAASGASENKLRFTLLTELLRLRQVCADPGMVDPEYPMEQSAKYLAFMELLQEALDGGHRILVFSQFVKLLKRLRSLLDDNGIRSEYIDGSTRDRLAVCDRFNGDPEIAVCLISLKAGGTGLNLTGADTVIHFDPWWNPAVEDQATDRAHRIGQQRTVTSYKLVTEGTVEDKVLALQVKKAALLRDLLDESAHQSAKVDLSTLKSLIAE
ncbi:MAG: SNF2-related protein [Puniceicoccaceae bacterium]